MKPKDLNKKLRLNKETLTDLNSNEQGNVKGGAFYITIRDWTCIEGYTCQQYTCMCPESYPLDTLCVICQP